VLISGGSSHDTRKSRIPRVSFNLYKDDSLQVSSQSKDNSRLIYHASVDLQQAISAAVPPGLELINSNIVSTTQSRAGLHSFREPVATTYQTA
jgi:hypothetical protein